MYKAVREVGNSTDGYYCDVCTNRPKEVILCIGCNTAQYCSSVCQREDWPGHQLICAPLLSQRLKKASQFLLTGNNNAPSSFNRNMSCETLYIKCEERCVSLRVYKKTCREADYCAICGEALYYIGESFNITFVFYLDSRRMRAMRCESCHNKKLMLCPESFMESTLCRDKQILSIYMLLKESLLCTQDVLSVIMKDVHLVCLTCNHL